MLVTVACIVVAQIRPLKMYGLAATFAVLLIWLTMFITMGFIAHSPPNYAISALGSVGGAVDPQTITPGPDGKYPAIMHYSGMPPGGLQGALNGLMTAIEAYSGVQLFVEMMAEMRRPRDFIKAVWGAQFVIYVSYVVYGCFVYYFQGQYTFSPAYLSISRYSWQTAANMLTLIAGLIGGGLYSNIGIKVFYNNIIYGFFRVPITSPTGKVIFAIIVPIWWFIAYVIGSAIPDFVGLISVVSAFVFLPMTYTLPPLFALGFDIQRRAVRPDLGEGFDPTTGKCVRHDGSVLRWVRGFFSGGVLQVAVNCWHVVFVLGSLVTCGLGMYSGITRSYYPPFFFLLYGWLLIVL